jgi:hypothetical protein
MVAGARQRNNECNHLNLLAPPQFHGGGRVLIPSRRRLGLLEAGAIGHVTKSHYFA